MRRDDFVLLFMLLLVLSPGVALADEVYQAPESFVAEAFPGVEPEKRALWIKKDLKQQVKQVLGHDLGRLRVRYWVHGHRTAWILEEIGKERLITVGIVVDSGVIERIRILVYRESIGWEVRFPFFTDQFRGAELREDTRLDRNIDGISGATLSVRAIEKLARLSLLLDAEVDHPDVGVPENAS